MYIFPGLVVSGGFRFLALCLPSLSFGPHYIDYITVCKSLSTVLFNDILVILTLLLGWYIIVVLYNNLMQSVVCSQALAYDLAICSLSTENDKNQIQCVYRIGILTQEMYSVIQRMSVSYMGLDILRTRLL